MELIDNTSAVATKTELDLFSVPQTQVSVERSFWQEIRPTNTVTDAGPYDFFIDGNQYYLDMSSNYVYLKIKIVMPDGTPLVHIPLVDGENDVQNDANRVAPINVLGKTFFKQIKLFINGKMTYDSGPDYPCLAYILTDLNYDKNAKETHLRAAGYYTDYAEDQHDPNVISTPGNRGWEARRQLFKNSKLVEYMAPLHMPFAHQERYLLSNMDVRVELHRVSDTYALLTPDQQPYKIVVDDIRFYIRKVEISRDLSLAMEHALLRMTAKYPIRRMELKTLSIGQGFRTAPTNVLWTGQIPKRVIVCTMNNTAYFGNYGHAPFNFQHHNIIKASLKVNGQCIPHSGPLEVQFKRQAHDEPNLVMRAFTQLYNSMGIGTWDKSNGISMNRFLGNACYFVFDLSADNAVDDANWELLHSGTVSVDLEFRNNIGEEGLRVLVLGEFDNLISIDHHRNIFYDYSV